MARLPVPRPPEASHEFKTLTTLARRISVAGIETSIADYAELNAVVAGLYGLSGEDYEHVLHTFPLLDGQLIAACLERYQQHPRKHGNTESLRHRDDFY
jgi:hypothetical protein